MIGSSTICGIVIGLIFTVIFGLTFYTIYVDLIIEHWLPQTIIAGIIIMIILFSRKLNVIHVEKEVISLQDAQTKKKIEVKEKIIKRIEEITTRIIIEVIIRRLII